MKREDRHCSRNENGHEAKLQVMICAYGKEGIRRVASGKHPAMPSVEYLVSWQTDDNTSLPVQLERKDFKIITSDTKGLAVNRNIALSHATAPFLLISDDDTDYTEDNLNAVLKGFRDYPDADILAFRFESKSVNKIYPDYVCPLDTPPKGYFISSIEIAFRKNSVKGKVWFNEYFGVGALFRSGEEDIFIKDCLDLGMKGFFLPETIVRHDASTTSTRDMHSPLRPMTKGAVFLRLHPRDWTLRMIAHALREIPLWIKGEVPSPVSFCRNWIKGVLTAREKHVFPTASQTLNYRNHE
ncbi:MAG: glycosyltransferase [Muribaculaceae bacterium]|nr:glycosyltransferase [Muribaculaceae bacterium]